jgi:AraC-like DNA-binding protein
MDLRRAGFLYYVAASSEILGDALQGIARCSTMLNEGIKLETGFGDALRVGFEYAGVSRRSDRHQIEAWTTAIVRCSRELTDRELQPVGVQIMHQRIPESAKIDAYFGCTAEFGADRDQVSFASEAAKLQIINADRYLNQLVTGYCENVLSRRKARSSLIQADVENAITALLPNGQARIENVARRLSLSPRTLRRKLAAEGVTFAGILEDLRSALAKHYLAEQDYLDLANCLAPRLHRGQLVFARFPALDRAYAARRPTTAATRATSGGCKAAVATLGPAPKKIAFWHRNTSFCPDIASFFRPHALRQLPTNKLHTNLGTFARAIDDD